MKLNMKKKTWKNIVQYAILIIVGIIMVYPLVWMCFAVFKTNAEIFSSAAIFPKKWVFDAFDGLGKPVGGQITLWKSMLNTYMIVIPKVVFTLISSVLTAYSFSRFRYPGRNLMFNGCYTVFAPGCFKCSAVYYVQQLGMDGFICSFDRSHLICS